MITERFFVKASLVAVSLLLNRNIYETRISIDHRNRFTLPWGKLIRYRIYLRVSLPKTGPLRFGSENQFLLNFAHEYILVQK